MLEFFFVIFFLLTFLLPISYFHPFFLSPSYSSHTSDPGSQRRFSSPLPTTVRAFVFIARRLAPFLPSSTRFDFFVSRDVATMLNYHQPLTRATVGVCSTYFFLRLCAWGALHPIKNTCFETMKKIGFEKKVNENPNGHAHGIRRHATKQIEGRNDAG